MIDMSRELASAADQAAYIHANLISPHTGTAAQASRAPTFASSFTNTSAVATLPRPAGPSTKPSQWHLAV